VPATPLAFSRHGLTGGPTLVLLHGFLGCQDDWDDLVEPLKDRFDAVVIDLPGHGSSADSPNHLYRFDSCSAALSETLRFLSVSAFTLVGYSMGGRIALQYAVHNFARIQSLVLIAANPGLESESERLSRLAADEQLSARMAGMPIDRFVDQWYGQPLFDSLRSHPAFGRIKRRRLEGDPAGLARALSGFSIGRQVPMWEKLTGLLMPVLCVAGELDRKHVEIARRTADLCPQGKLHIIPQAGHAVHLEKPDELSRAIAEFAAAHS
jgi:2-succinyl-6-hydroxy-2,4-cyclohexadiene-1-carboxylate synthase